MNFLNKTIRSKKNTKVLVFGSAFLLLVFGFAQYGMAQSDRMDYVSDLISDSAPGATTTTHRIQFTLINAIPASGEIVITPIGGAFNIPAALDYTDIDLSVATNTVYVDRSLAAVANASDDGIAITSGMSGEIRITLNSSSGIGAGDAVRVEIGNNATYGVTGDQFIVSPSTIRAYTIDMVTYDNLAAPLDWAYAAIAIVEPVTVSAGVDVVIPSRSNGLPSGEIAAGNSTIEISLSTDVWATCRYATSSGVIYSSMTGTFTGMSSSTIHAVVLGGFQDETSYSFFVRCAGAQGIPNDDDYEISFSLKEWVDSEEGGDPHRQSGNISGGSPRLYLSVLSLEGWSYPASKVTVLKDGEKYNTLTARSDGTFNEIVRDLERGVYSFAIYAEDSEGRISSTYSAVLFIEQGTSNRISNIVIPPTIELRDDEVELGGEVFVFGESPPGVKIEVSVGLQLGEGRLGERKKFTASSTMGVPGLPDGSWGLVFDTEGLSKGTYEVKARAFVEDNSPGEQEQAESEYSQVLFLGIGEEPSPDFSLRADLNKDGSVNLVDFSILLFHWSTSDGNADINSSGSVDLSDFSIMLFHWTG